MAETTSVWVNFNIEDLQLPEGTSVGDLIMDSSFTDSSGEVLTVEFCKKDE